MAVNYFYKHYEIIRTMIRQWYLYGCFSRDDYKTIISGRKFDNELKRAKMILNPNNIIQSFRGKKKYTSIIYDYFSDNQNILADTYLAKAFSANEFILYFFIMQTLEKEPSSLSEIEERMTQFISDIDRATIRNHLNKMCSEGYLASSTLKNKKVYSLGKDILADFTKKELSEILDAVAFYMNFSKLQMPGIYCYKTILEHSGIKHNNPFVFQHKFLHQILDEEILQGLCNAIKERKSISFDYSNIHCSNITPIKIKRDDCFGRVYLIGFNIEKNCISIFRTDKITNISEGSLYAYVSEDLTKYCWSVSWKPNHENISVIFEFNEVTDDYLIRRLYREKKHGSVQKNDKGQFVFIIVVTDPVELVPWLRTFYGHIVTTSCEKLKDYLKEDVEQLVMNYENI